MTRLRQSELVELLVDQGYDTADLCVMLEISPAELLSRFGDKLREHREKFDLPGTIDGIYDEEDEGFVDDAEDEFPDLDDEDEETED